MRSVVTIGAYDGVHRGHQAVIAQVKATAQQLGCRSVVITFDRHPASVVRPESAPKLLTDIDQKLELLEKTGVDATMIVSFDASQSTEEPASFVKRVLVDALNTQVIVVGEDFHFGVKRAGNVAMLRDLGKQFDFEVAPVQLIQRPDGVTEPVSSTSIRRALAGGQVEVATNLLGRAYEVRGVVVNGDKRGRTIGFPTANVEVPNAMCLPADGVYA
jgi:riboflavin kinase/FMN adenylyltransferase